MRSGSAGVSRGTSYMMRAAIHLDAVRANYIGFNVLGWAFSWTNPLSPRLPGGIPASEAAQGRVTRYE